MRSRSCATILPIMALCLFAQFLIPQTARDSGDYQTGYCPKTRELEAEPSQKFFFDGTIGKRHARMFLDRGGSDVVGLFFYSSGDWNPTSLGGEWKNGNIEMSDGTETHPATGRLIAFLTENRLTGTWTVSNSAHSEAVNLNAIPEPRCEGNERWKRFEDSTWPLSFSYPSSWHIEQSGKTVTISCPNPAAIASEDQVVIYAGTGDPDGPPDEPTELLKCGDTWRYGGSSFCDCKQADSLSCGTAKVTHKGSASILDVSEREWRVYCRDGGYVALGYGEDLVLLIDGNWLEVVGQGQSSEIVDRLLDTVTPQKARKEQ
jgi:hypothetical protein